MFAIVKNPHIFLIGTPFLLLMASAIKIDRYETNSMKNLGSYSQLIISPDSFKKMKLKQYDWFKYWIEGKENIGQVMYIDSGRDGYEVAITPSKEKVPISLISYRLEKRSIWSEVFK